MDEARERFGELVAPAPAPRRRASPISICATPPTPTKPCRTRSSRCSPTSRRIARPGRSRSGSRGFSSTAASIGARRGPPRPLVRAAATSRARTKRAPRRPAPPSDPEAPAARRASAARGWRGAIDRLDGRQRTVFMLCHYGDCTPREVSAMTGLNESTVRVHLFRAARKLRGLLGGTAVIASRAPPPGRPPVRLLPGRARRRAARSAGRRASGRLRRVRRALRRARRVHGRAARATATPRPTPSSRPSACAPSSSRSPAASRTSAGRPASSASPAASSAARSTPRRRAPRRAGSPPPPPPACSSASRSARRSQWRSQLQGRQTVSSPTRAARASQRLTPGRHARQRPGRRRRRRRVPVGSRDRARAAAHPRAAGVRRAHAARARDQSAIMR